MLTTLWRQTATGLRLLILLTVLCGVVYPLAVWGVAHLPGLSGRAEGSVVTAGGAPAGSSLIGVDPVAADPNNDPFFHTRPSATAQDVLGPGDTTTSGGSNLAGDSTKLLQQVAQRRAAIAAREGVAPEQVPPDAVTASASGLDPDISPAYAALQVPRVARVNGLPVGRVQALVAEATDGRALGFLGEPTVNVTELNLAVQHAVSGK
ncbi:K(+)-transporting ATPase subunit C [Pseudonocardia acidicola]|uniref:Potassium-transporting ATPase KdpC subunit n=1 Tax=Pseudonocardia acidicola TaxID=2724939 RepID=A0ABX1SD88_9PSEU|nr:K(+)-transporting ATPase subunit C [Pseudonocardia acidicola]NMH98864.1 K(+)-transporting ATPase subunit C [Pseudonocardia acidicola]